MLQLTPHALLSPFARRAMTLIAAVTLTACTSVDNDPADPQRTGVFLDAAVAGLNYETDTSSGITNADGQFNFIAGEMVTFSIGDLELPAVPGEDIVTPLDLFGASDVDDTRVVNLSRLLQSLDTDANPDNGIDLPHAELTDGATTLANIDFASPEFDVQADVALSSTISSYTALVDTDTATAHLTQSLIENNLISDGCTADHPFVGRSSELSNLAHGVSGTVTVLDDCTLEVTNFNYDGGGPAVFFYAANDRDFRNFTAIIGPRLNGQRWVNNTLVLPIPEGTTLDDFNSLSVWCQDFNANFGDVFIGNT